MVQSKRYWEAYYIAGHGYAMARGWYRQDDYPTNAVLYNNPTAATYQAWLRSVGVRYVLLQSGTLDFTADAEAALLRGGTSGLQLVAQTGAWSVYALPAPTPIVTPADAARITRITPTTIAIQATRPATLTVRVHDTPVLDRPECRRVGVCRGRHRRHDDGGGAACRRRRTALRDPARQRPAGAARLAHVLPAGADALGARDG